MSERLRIGNVYEHSAHGDIIIVYRDHDNTVYYRTVEGRDNAGVTRASEALHHDDYRDLLGDVSTLSYPDDWTAKARAIRQRDGHTCQGCGVSGNDTELHVHHIVPLGAGGSNARSNLITLCEECHRRVHGGVT